MKAHFSSIIMQVHVTTQMKPGLIGEKTVIENAMTILKKVTKPVTEE